MPYTLVKSSARWESTATSEAMYAAAHGRRRARAQGDNQHGQGRHDRGGQQGVGEVAMPVQVSQRAPGHAHHVEVGRVGGKHQQPAGAAGTSAGETGAVEEVSGDRVGEGIHGDAPRIVKSKVKGQKPEVVEPAAAWQGSVKRPQQRPHGIRAEHRGVTRFRGQTAQGELDIQRIESGQLRARPAENEFGEGGAGADGCGAGPRVR